MGSKGIIDYEDLNGTTAVGVHTKHGIFVAVDSRKSREWVPKHARNNSWIPKISDNATKWRPVTERLKRIIAIRVGNAADGERMLDHVEMELEPLEDNGEDITVAHVSKIAYNYMDKLREKNKAFGVLIAGSDDTNGFQMYRIFIKGKIVVNEQDRWIAALGSGYGYANDILVYGYDFNLSIDDALLLVIKAVLNGTCYDKSSGGTIRVFQLTNTTCIVMRPRKVLNAFFDNFEHYESGRMLFLIHEVRDQTQADHLSSDHFVNFFRLYGDILVAHRVDWRKSHNFKFFFHRLVFTSSEEVRKVLSSPMMEKYLHEDSHAPILSKFSYKVTLDVGGKIGELLLRIEKASKELVEYMIKSCPIQNRKEEA